MKPFRSDQIALLVATQREEHDRSWRAPTLNGLFRSLTMSYLLRSFAERDMERAGFIRLPRRRSDQT